MNWFKGNIREKVLAGVIIVTGIFISVLSARMIPVKNDVRVDTVYIERESKCAQDSLLQHISKQLKEINGKLTPKKVYVNRQKRKCDTIRIDANVRVEK